MYLNSLRAIDIVSILFSALAAICLWFSDGSLFWAVILPISTILVLRAKFFHDRYHLFAAYACSLAYFGNQLIESLSGKFVYFSHPSSAYVIVAAVLAISIGAAVTRFGTGTLSLLWFTAHVLILWETLRPSQHTDFREYFWSLPAVNGAIYTYYPLLLAALLIGFFLDKYKRALVLDKLFK